MILKLTKAELEALPEHRFDHPPSLNLFLGKRLKWNSRQMLLTVGSDGPKAKPRMVKMLPPHWKVWEVFYVPESNNLDVRLLDVEIIK